MKKFKIVLSGTALVVAVGMAFASTSIDTDADIQQLYRIVDDECVVQTECSPLFTGPECEFTVYQTRTGAGECITPIAAFQDEPEL